MVTIYHLESWCFAIFQFFDNVLDFFKFGKLFNGDVEQGVRECSGLLIYTTLVIWVFDTFLV